MRRLAVASNTIRSIGYDGCRRELEVEFLESGDVYQYFDVSAEEYTEFMAADSKGTYLNLVFKTKEHRYLVVKKGLKHD